MSPTLRQMRVRHALTALGFEFSLIGEGWSWPVFRSLWRPARPFDRERVGL